LVFTGEFEYEGRILTFFPVPRDGMSLVAANENPDIRISVGLINDRLVASWPELARTLFGFEAPLEIVEEMY
jgi:hypothetical protein